MIYKRGHLARPLDVAFGTASRASVLRALILSKDGLGGREAARAASVSHQMASRELKSLETAGLVEKRPAGRSLHWRVVPGHALIARMLKPLFEAEAEHADEIVELIRKHLAEDAENILLVGPAATGRLEARSPLELLVVYDAAFKRPVAEGVRKLEAELISRYGIRLKPTVVTRKQSQLDPRLFTAWQLSPTEGPPTVFIG
jgi:DNA-binding transcriptional ArsR family regulator